MKKMIIDDVRRIEKLKKELGDNPNHAKKIEKLEKKYVSIQDAGDDVKAIYMDKHKSKVIVLRNGEIFQIEGPVVNPHFTGFLIAYVVMGLIGVPLMIFGVIFPSFMPIANAINTLIIPASIILNILTVIFNKRVLMERKVLLFLVIILFVFNVFQLIN